MDFYTKLFLKIIFKRAQPPFFSRKKARPTPFDHCKIQDPPPETSDPPLTIINEPSLTGKSLKQREEFTGGTKQYGLS